MRALEKADYPSVRGSFTYGKNHYPIQAYYQRVIQKDASGRITNKLVGKVFDKYHRTSTSGNANRATPKR